MEESPEHLLLTQAVKGDPLPHTPPSINWASLTQLLNHNELAPLFYEWIQGQPQLKGLMPEGLLGDFKRGYLFTASMNIRRREELKKILRLLGENKIPVILHKGVLLAEEIYEGIGARPMVDVDLIVRHEDFTRADQILKSENFPLIVDLHNDIINTDRFKMIQKEPSLRIQRMWKQARSIEFDGIPALALSPEDQFIALSLHLAFNHRLQGLLWFADLVRLLKKHGAISPPPFILPPQVGEDRGEGAFSWNLLVERSREYENSRSVFYCLSYLDEKLDVAIPEWVLEALRPDRQGLLERFLLKRVWKGKDSGRWSYFLSLALLENKRLRRRYFWLTFVTLRGFSLLGAAGAPRRASCHT